MKRGMFRKNSKWTASIVFFTWVFFLTFGLAVSGQAKTAIQMVSASMGGDTYFWIAVASKILNEELTDYEFSVRAGTTSANMLQLEKGEIPIAYGNALIYATMYNKEALKTTRIREIWMMNGRAWILIVPKDSPAKTIYDLKGKKISCGIRTGEGAIFLDYLNALGLSTDDFKPFFIGKGEGIEAFKNGSVDALAGVSVIPSSMFSQVAASRRGARLIEFSDSDLEKILPPRKPFESLSIIPAGTHPEIEKDVKAIMGWDPLCARDDLSSELVYRIAKALHKRHKDLIQAFPPAKYSTAENLIKNHGFPIHFGTEKFLKEIKLGGTK